MKLFFILVAILSSCTLYLKAECPSINSIPVMNAEGTNFYCAEVWDGIGSASPIEGCNALSHDPGFLSKGDDLDAGCINNLYYPTGSIIVKAGCVLYGWNQCGYTGTRREYPGPGVYPNGCPDPYNTDTCPRELWDGVHGWGHVSIKCRCEQEAIVCEPEDGWERIMQCDNSDGSTTTTCKYKKTIGTTYSTEVQHSMSIDLSVAAALKENYFTLFSAELSTSASTGYDWTHTSSETMSEEHSYEVDTEVPPGTVVMIDGAIGRCGGSTSKTELFKISSYDQEGILIAEHFEGIEGKIQKLDIM